MGFRRLGAACCRLLASPHRDRGREFVSTGVAYCRPSSPRYPRRPPHARGGQCESSCDTPQHHRTTVGHERWRDMTSTRLLARVCAPPCLGPRRRRRTTMRAVTRVLTTTTSVLLEISASIGSDCTLRLPPPPSATRPHFTPSHPSPPCPLCLSYLALLFPPPRFSPLASNPPPDAYSHG